MNGIQSKNQRIGAYELKKGILFCFDVKFILLIMKLVR